MNKAKIYFPAKTSTQSGRGKLQKWILEFDRENLEKDFVMGWDSSSDTKKQIKITFETKDETIAISEERREGKERKYRLTTYT